MAFQLHVASPAMLFVVLCVIVEAGDQRGAVGVDDSQNIVIAAAESRNISLQADAVLVNGVDLAAYISVLQSTIDILHISSAILLSSEGAQHSTIVAQQATTESPPSTAPWPPWATASRS